MSQFDPTPPTFGDFDLPEQRPGWPTGLGIFSIVWGSLAVICGVCGAAMTLFMGKFLEFFANMQGQSGQAAPPGQQLPTGPIPPELSPNLVQVVGTLIHPIGGIVLLIAGILLVQRNPSARPAHLAYAVLSMLSTLLGLAGAFMYKASMEQFTAANPDDEWGNFLSAQSPPAMQLAQAVGISVVSLIYPIFVLVWFGVIKKRPEDMGPPRAELVA